MKKILFAAVFLLILVGCGNDSESNEEANTPDNTEETHAVVFRNLDLQTEANTYTLAGEVRAEDGQFYYQLEQGEEELHPETVYELEGEPGVWEDIEISGEIPASAFDSEEAPILTLYSKSPEGQALHPNFIPIDIAE